jgi:CheY-like chemotaxis protein
VKSSASALLRVLNDILDFSKVEAGKLELLPADLDLRKCLDDVLAVVAFGARQKGLALKATITPGTPEWLLGDDARLRQILINLAGNAVKFTEADGVQIAVAAEAEPGDGILLRFSVTDTGPGIPPEKQALVFAPFEQGDASMARRFGGTGLGLAITAKLVALMNGRIWVESPWRDPASGRTNAGSAFHFTVRLARAAGPRPRPTIDAGAPIPARALRVLVVEDNAVNRQLACHLLTKRGHKVVTAEDGLEAVSAVEKQDVDLVLMDVQMPRMDGLTATRTIRERERTAGFPRRPIVAMTAHAMSGDREQCLGAGMDGYITKPIRVAELDRILVEVAQQCHVAD